ncbi:hypothetical protein PCANC_14492 [Puccinia coronata f. sp. avenae]|uniref:DUF659 domain-containing protein n=1 Tax=Puccinia coronata f. sp. avenae TaxID=200324 RepID=A0A2N5SLX8_9BASI|nr:hypothetical protein PCANC_14492 [Puccinia coronata f. sp. avenae]
MAGTRSSKKRRKANASSSSSVSSSPAQPSRNQRNKKIISLVNDSKDEPTPTTIDNPADSTQPAKLQEMTDEQELSVGVMGTGDVEVREVPQLCAIWCAAGAHSFLALGEQAHRGILHPIVARNLPPRKAISADILRLYTAVQELLMESLKRHQGAMYLGLNVWQSPNGFDILGTVIYRLVEQPGSGGKFELEAMPLDFVHLQQSHTGVYLAKTVQLIVDKFGVKNKICGSITDNASNNQTMINKISSYKWPRFHGEPQWICCFAHILNLIAQSILRPFGCHKKKENSDYDDKSNGSILETEEVDDQIQLMLKDNVDSDDKGEDSQEEDDLAQGFAEDDNIELEDNNVNDLSGEDEGDP